jgi:predicted amidophosphoribosyltransferase
MNIIDFFCPLQKPNLKLSHHKLFVKKIHLGQSDMTQIWVALKYQEGCVSETILNAKSGVWSLSNILSFWLYESIKLDFDYLFKPSTLISFVPKDPYRTLVRGYHLPELIAKQISDYTNINAVNLLIKPKITKAQGRLNREEGVTNLVDKFVFDEICKINLSKYDNLLLIDDITTTGSTLLESYKVIKNKCPWLKIYPIALASN